MTYRSEQCKGTRVSRIQISDADLLRRFGSESPSAPTDPGSPAGATSASQPQWALNGRGEWVQVPPDWQNQTLEPVPERPFWSNLRENLEQSAYESLPAGLRWTSAARANGGYGPRQGGVSGFIGRTIGGFAGLAGNAEQIPANVLGWGAGRVARTAAGPIIEATAERFGARAGSALANAIEGGAGGAPIAGLQRAGQIGPQGFAEDPLGSAMSVARATVVGGATGVGLGAATGAVGRAGEAEAAAGRMGQAARSIDQAPLTGPSVEQAGLDAYQRAYRESPRYDPYADVRPTSDNPAVGPLNVDRPLNSLDLEDPNAAPAQAPIDDSIPLAPDPNAPVPPPPPQPYRLAEEVPALPPPTIPLRGGGVMETPAGLSSDLAGMSVSDLRTLAREYGVMQGPRSREALIARLVDLRRQGAPSEPPTPPPPPFLRDYPPALPPPSLELPNQGGVMVRPGGVGGDLANMKLGELRALAREYGLMDGPRDRASLVARLVELRREGPPSPPEIPGDTAPPEVARMSQDRPELEARYRLPKPIEGKTGAKIVGYQWMSQMEEGMFRDRRVSDWSRKTTSEPTGRDIVHVYWVQTPDGETSVMGVGAAKKALGMPESRLRTIAEQEQRNQRIRAQQWDTSERTTLAKAATSREQADAEYRKANSPDKMMWGTREQHRAKAEELFAASRVITKDGRYLRTGDQQIIDAYTTRGWIEEPQPAGESAARTPSERDPNGNRQQAEDQGRQGLLRPESPRQQSVAGAGETPAPVVRSAKTAAQRSKPSIRQYTKGQIEQQIADAYDALQIEQPRSTDAETTGAALVYPPKMVGEVESILKALPPHARRFFRKARTGERAGFEDFLHDAGEGGVIAEVERLMGLNVRSAKEFFKANPSVNPEATFLTTLHDNLPRGRMKAMDQIDPKALPEGARFTINGEKFRVETVGTGEGEYRVLTDGDTYPTTPVEAIEKPIPVDRGSVLFETRRDVGSQAAIEDARAAMERTRELDMDKGMKAPTEAFDFAQGDDQPGDGPQWDGGDPFNFTDGMPAPGSTSYSFRQPKTMQGKPRARVTPMAIIDQMQKLGDIPIRVGHGQFAQHRAMGWYRASNQVIRMRTANDLVTAAHEFGHAIHDSVLKGQIGVGQVRDELRALGKNMYGNRQPNGGYFREGMAEYVARRLAGDDMTTTAPALHKWFQDTIERDNPGFAAGFKRLGGMFQNWDTQGAPGRVAAMIDRLPTNPVERVQTEVRRVGGFGRLVGLLQRAFTNDAALLERAEATLAEDIGKKLGPTESPATMRAALSMTARGQARAFIEQFTTDIRGKRTGASLSDVLQPVKSQLHEFGVYLAARRAQALRTNGIKGFANLSDADVDATVQQLQTPAFEAAAQGVTEYSGRLLDYVVESGGMDRATADMIQKTYPIYVPFMRIMDGSPRGGGVGRGEVNTPGAVKRIKGSGRAIADPIEALTLHTERMLTLANKMRVGRAIANAVDQNPRLPAWFAEEIPAPQEATSFRLQDVAKAIEDAGGDLSSADPNAVLTVFQNASFFRNTKGDPIVAVWKDGRRRFFQVDEDVFGAISGMDKEVLPAWMAAIFGKAAAWTRLGATGVNSGFAVRNVIRDGLTWSIYTASDKRFPAKFGGLDIQVKGLWDKLTSDAGYEHWKSLGGELSTIMGQDRYAARRRVTEALPRTLGEKAITTARHPVDALRGAIGAFESSPRIREFKAVLEKAEAKYGKGSEDAVITALLASKDVTTDFTRAGLVGRAMNQLIPFFNAQIQGSSKFFRTFGSSKAMVATARAVSLFTVPSLLLWWANRDQKWYQELSNDERLNYWHVSLDGGKNIWRIPKPFELGRVFGSMPEVAMDAMYHRDPRRATESLLATLGGFLPVQSATDLMPAAIKPAVEAVANYDSFRRRPIVAQYEADQKLPAEQYGRYTTETAKAIGRLLEVSPRKIEHLMSGYTGGLATNMVRAMETTAGVGKARQNQGIRGVPVIGTLAGRNPVGQGETVERFYTAAREANQRAGSPSAMGFDKAEASQFDDLVSQISQIRKRMAAGGMDEARGLARIQSIAERGVAVQKQFAERRKRRSGATDDMASLVR